MTIIDEKNSVGHDLSETEIHELILECSTREVFRTKLIEAFEKEKPGVRHLYQVERLRNGMTIQLERPGRKEGDYDFKILVDDWAPFHDEVIEDLGLKKRENSSDYTKLLSSIRIVYDCGDMGTALGICEELSLKQGLDTELTLKLLKWMFIAEDVNYPHSWSMGREMLMKKIDEI